MDEKIVEQSMQLIMHAGTGRSGVMEALKKMLTDGNCHEARQAINEASQEIGLAHGIQTDLMTQECDGQAVEKSILLIHAQDHFMNALTVRDLGLIIVDLYEKLAATKQD